MLNIWHDLGRPVIGLPVLGMVAVVAIFSVRWLNRRRRPDPASIEPVEFSGRTRAAFLQRVWAQRIVNGLESSLQQAAEIALGMRNTPELVKLSYSESTAEPGELLSVEEAYGIFNGAPYGVVGGGTCCCKMAWIAGNSYRLRPGTQRTSPAPFWLV